MDKKAPKVSLKCLARPNKGMKPAGKVPSPPEAYLCVECGHKQTGKAEECKACGGMLCRICAVCLYTKLSQYNRSKFCSICQRKRITGGLSVSEETEDERP